MQTLISGALSFSITAYQLDFLYLVLQLLLLQLVPEIRELGNAYVDTCQKCFLFFWFCVTHMSKGHLTADRSGHGVLDTLTLRLLMSYIYIYMQHPFLMFIDHIQRRTTVGRTPLDEWSARRRDLYPTTRDTHTPQAARLLRSWVRIPPGAWIFVCC